MSRYGQDEEIDEAILLWFRVGERSVKPRTLVDVCDDRRRLSLLCTVQTRISVSAGPFAHDIWRGVLSDDAVHMKYVQYYILYIHTYTHNNDPWSMGINVDLEAALVAIVWPHTKLRQDRKSLGY